MAYDERDESDEDEAGQPSALSRYVGRARKYLFERPFACGLVCAVAAMLFFALALPAPPHDGTAAIAIPGEPAATVQETGTHAADTTREETKSETSPEAAAPAKPEEKSSEKAAEPKTTPPRITAETALLLTDVGLSRRIAEAIDRTMPKEASLAISPYAADPAGMASAFKATGRDVWLQIAAQSVRAGIDPGPLALSSGLTTKENGDLMKRQIAAVSGHALGIYMPDDADVIGQSEMWRSIAMDLIATNMMILDGTKTQVDTELYIQKSESKISAYLKADLVIDGAATPAALKADLAAATAAILRERQAIVVVRNPTVLAVETVGGWIGTLADSGISLVPASKFTGLKP